MPTSRVRGMFFSINFKAESIEWVQGIQIKSKQPGSTDLTIDDFFSIIRYAKALIGGLLAEFDVQPPDPMAFARHLSGGNFS